MTATRKSTARPEPYEYRLRIHRPWSRGFHTVLSDYGNYATTEIVTAFGGVGVYFQEGGSPFTTMSFSAKGYFYSRTWHRTFSRRWLVTLADRFARDCAKAVRS